MRQDRSFGLDLLRAMAILFVMICHGLFIFYGALYQPLGNLLTRYGHYGVSLFFVLSGFLIGRIFIDDYTSKSSYTFTDVFTFWKRRWFRTLPNYYFFFMVYLVVHLLVSRHYLQTEVWTPNFTLKSYGLLPGYLFFGQNLVTENPTFFGQSWSLAVEEWFYLLLPFAFMGLASYRVKSRLSLSLKLGALLVALTGAKFLVFFFIPSFYNEIKVVFSLDFILYGVVIAALYHEYTPVMEKGKTLFLAFGTGLFLLTNWLYLTTVLAGKKAELYQLIINCVTSLSFACALPFFINLRFKKGALTFLIEKISLSSYTLYLSHFIFLEFFIQGFLLKFFPDSGSFYRLIAFGIFLVVCTLFSYGHFVCFEKPVMKLRDSIRGQNIFRYGFYKMQAIVTVNRKKFD